MASETAGDAHARCQALEDEELTPRCSEQRWRPSTCWSTSLRRCAAAASSGWTRCTWWNEERGRNLPRSVPDLQYTHSQKCSPTAAESIKKPSWLSGWKNIEVISDINDTPSSASERRYQSRSEHRLCLTAASGQPESPWHQCSKRAWLQSSFHIKSHAKMQMVSKETTYGSAGYRECSCCRFKIFK